jgi:hypothetical protein
VPDLLMARAMGTVVWRAGRWRRGQASLDEVPVRLHDLSAADKWLTAHGSELCEEVSRVAIAASGNLFVGGCIRSREVTG